MLNIFGLAVITSRILIPHLSDESPQMDFKQAEVFIDWLIIIDVDALISLHKMLIFLHIISLSAKTEQNYNYSPK